MTKTIFITGAASGIGKATAARFSQRGWRVGCYDLDTEGARAVAAELGTSCSPGHIDVRNEASWRKAIGDFVGDTSQLDVLFNCAGILRMGRFEDVGPADSRDQLETNVMGVVLGIQVCLPFLEKAQGTVINMSSASAIYGQPELAVYSASKFAVRALTEALDIELREKAVRVTDIMPGYVDTPMLSSQTYRAASLRKLGIKLKAEDIAALAWKAAHGTKMHHIPQANMRMFSRLSSFWPSLSRLTMRRLVEPGR